jgi:glucose/arabinose dehydrogenase/mono/diheme cytochrome c family protein
MPICFQGGLCSRLFALCLAAAPLGQTLLAAGLNREANSTLALPLEPFQYKTVNAFPGLVFAEPVAIVSPPGETNRLFILERAGRIQVISNLANPTKTLFLDITGRVDLAGEGGLLGLAFHPGYKTNRFFYVYYTLTTTTAQGTGFHDRLARFEISPDDPNQAMSDSDLPLITQIDRANNHNGGDVHFGPDGYLYVSLGDEGDGGDTFKNSQLIDRNFFSAMLRIDVDLRPDSLPPNSHLASSTNYAIPPDNPFIGATSFNGSAVSPDAVRTEFWAVGLRNPYRFSFDPVTEWLYCGDVGQGLWEEIDRIVKGGNYGWSIREGAHEYNGDQPPGATLIEPILDYAHGGGSSEGNCVIGGVVYRGTKIPQLFSDYIFGDFGSGNIWALQFDGVKVSNFRQLSSLANVCAFGQDPANGDILMGQAASGEVPVYRLVYANEGGTSLPRTLADTGAFANLAALQPETGVVAYDLNVPFWSDNARKKRWFSVPEIKDEIDFSSNGNWTFPEGTVWIKHFDLEMTNGVPESARRLETRFLVRNSRGVYGITYRWDDTQTNAFLVSEDGMDETLLVQDGGMVRTQVWHYPARSECVTCHTPAGGLALGFNTFQLNRDLDYGGTVTNQILGLNQMGYFTTAVTNVASALMYAQASDETATVQHRVRSYLGANCVQCHQPGGAGLGFWDARLNTPLSEAGIVNGDLVDYVGDANNKVIKPGSLEHSMMLDRISGLGSRHMPPLATLELNQEAIALLARWITNDLAMFSVELPTGHLGYTANDGPVVLDPRAIITIASDTNLAGGSLTIEFILNGATEDRWAVRHVGNGNGEIGVSDNIISYGGVTIGTFAGGTSGTEPLVVRFSSSLTSEAAQALLRNVTYENVSQAPSTLARTVHATLANSDGSTSSQASMTISVQSVTAVPVVVWDRPADIVYGAPLTAAQLNPSANIPGTFIFNPPIGHLLNVGNDQVLAATFTPQDRNNYIEVTVSNLITVTKAPLVITADNKSKVYGQPNPPLTAGYGAFANGETAADLDVPVSLTTGATTASAVGAYPIVASGASDANYEITLIDGVLTIEPNAQVNSITLESGGQVRIRFTGLSGRAYRLEASGDLSFWATAGTVQADANGDGEFLELAVVDRSTSRFYRLVWP